MDTARTKKKKEDKAKNLYHILIEIYAELSDNKVIGKSGMIIKLSCCFMFLFEANHSSFIKY
jgi:hypothetical protein